MERLEAQAWSWSCNKPRRGRAHVGAGVALFSEICVRAGRAKKTFPGFSAIAFVRLDNSPGEQNRYVFDRATSDGAGAAFYRLSASSLFIFSIRNTHGEFYNLEIPVGDKGIPTERYVFLYCEAGVGKDLTVARVMIDGKEIRRRVLNFPMDFGRQDWKPVKGEVDGKGSKQAPFEIGMLSIGQETLSDPDIRNHYLLFIQFLKDHVGVK